MGGSGSAWASSARFPVSAPTGCAGAGKASIHRSAWKGNYANFVITAEFSEVRARVGTLAPSS